MKDILNVIKEYQKLDFNNKYNYLHSIDIESYKTQCKNFFAKKSNRDYFLEIANENIFIDNESEKTFVEWLNVEWYDKKGRDLFCWFKPSCW